MDKLDLARANTIDENIAKIVSIFPGCVHECMDENGDTSLKIDFEALKMELGGSVADGVQERYQITWPGKKEAILSANSPLNKTFIPMLEESINFFETKNLFIEGDNLDALKLLQESYLGKVKFIYIDPPYNTGKDFVYKDKFSSSEKDYLELSNQVSRDGFKLLANTESNGRMHSDWLNMIYPRLKLARNLLAEDGAIFISIDDNEVHSLRRLCDEIFGESNFLCQFVWKSDGNFDNQAKIKVCHEYILMYAKSEVNFPHPPVIDPNTPSNSKLFNSEIKNTIIKNGPKNPISKVTLPIGFPAESHSGKIPIRSTPWPRYLNEANFKDGYLTEEVIVESGWSSKDLLEDFIKNDCQPIRDAKGQETIFRVSNSGAIEAIKTRSDYQSHVISVLSGFGGTQKATKQLEELGCIFNGYPKPVELIRYLLRMVADKDCICLDFFAGSGTLGQAVLEQNQEDGGKREFVLVQLPEVLSPLVQVQKQASDFCDELKVPRSVAELTKQRLFRVSKKMQESSLPGFNIDFGYRVLKINSSNFICESDKPDSVNQADLINHIDIVKNGRGGLDVLFEIMNRYSLELSLAIKKEVIDGKNIYFVDDNSLIACLDSDYLIDSKLIQSIANHKPLRVVLRDISFKDDSMKINAEQIFKSISPNTEIKTI